ncbi:hypothetical protein JW935_01605 [candidate division KSB1 bacterium]|nr:hypothetical protein [candidate division KSB1 bacterium]
MVDASLLNNFCKKCQHRDGSLSRGILCGLTKNKPDFEQTCPDYVEDPDEAKRISRLETSSVKHQTRSEVGEGGNGCVNWLIWIGILVVINIILAACGSDWIVY